MLGLLIRDIQDCCQSSARTTAAILLEHSQMAAGRHPCNVDQQLAQLYPEQACHRLSHATDEGGTKAVSGRGGRRPEWQGLL